MVPAVVIIASKGLRSWSLLSSLNVPAKAIAHGSNLTSEALNQRRFKITFYSHCILNIRLKNNKNVIKKK